MLSDLLLVETFNSDDYSSFTAWNNAITVYIDDVNNTVFTVDWTRSSVKIANDIAVVELMGC